MISLPSSVGAVFFTQPLDLVKNRMQMSGKSVSIKYKTPSTGINLFTRVSVIVLFCNTF